MKEDKKYLGKDVLSKVDNAFNSVINDIVNRLNDPSIIALIYMVKGAVMEKLKEEK